MFIINIEKKGYVLIVKLIGTDIIGFYEAKSYDYEIITPLLFYQYPSLELMQEVLI